MAEPVADSYISGLATGQMYLDLPNGDCQEISDLFGLQFDPDDAGTFMDDPIWKDLAENATAPEHYKAALTQLGGLITSLSPREIHAISWFDPIQCSAFCDARTACQAFSMTTIRVPTLNVSREQCPDPASVSGAACFLYDETVTRGVSTLPYAYWGIFKVVYPKTNVYNKETKSKRDDFKPGCNGAPVVVNGGFEAGVTGSDAAPTGWELHRLSPQVTTDLTRPGSPLSGGIYAFVGRLAQGPNASFALSQNLNTCPGYKYSLTLDYRSDNAVASKCVLSVMVADASEPGQRALTSTADSEGEAAKPHQWYQLKTAFEAVTHADQLTISATCNDVWNNFSLDNIVIEALGA